MTVKKQYAMYDRRRRELKLGITARTITERHQELSKNYGLRLDDLYPIIAWPGTDLTEKRLHKQLEDYCRKSRTRGREFFECNGEVLFVVAHQAANATGEKPSDVLWEICERLALIHDGGTWDVMDVMVPCYLCKILIRYCDMCEDGNEFMWCEDCWQLIGQYQQREAA